VEITYKNNWNDAEKHFSVPGLKIFNFHPVHIFLNSNSMNNYKELKINGYPDVKENEIQKYKNNNTGINTFFKNLIEILTNKKTHTITDISKIFKNYN